jgi:hypothetical protein
VTDLTCHFYKSTEPDVISKRHIYPEWDGGDVIYNAYTEEDRVSDCCLTPNE